MGYTEQESQAAMVRFVGYADNQLAVARANDPELALIQIRQAKRELTYAEAFGVDALRARGWSWTQVGELLGITRQAAQQRFAETPQP